MGRWSMTVYPFLYEMSITESLRIAKNNIIQSPSSVFSIQNRGLAEMFVWSYTDLWHGVIHPP